ncbi:tryptophan synthase subunit alpha [Acanthopleuribacter pedis]|uniref:Tryptophan synthase alpha chain n=1 Tax=Acanthopleuribacter pedis TaxID=442870 RepID=A0A8J7U5E8_9BACT|nr:tryptophan synthase subunit alpha [Acanthopleuribacter pedis]
MKKLLVPYLTAGFPQREWFEPIVRAMDEGGADYIEIGVPFSDPIADGPTIQNASQKALDNGTTPRWILDEIKRFRGDLNAELIFFSYFNPILALDGLEGAAKHLKDAGFHGVLVPDLSLEQAEHFAGAMAAEGVHYIPLIAPTTTEERLKKIAPVTTSFAYGVSVTGVTGARKGVAQGLDEYLARVRNLLQRPFVVGFGISTPEDARAIARQADGVVVGSALIRLMEQAEDLDDCVKRVKTFISELRQAIDE